jgi:hypothetical protein
MPGGVPVTSTRALTNATLPFVLRLANEGAPSFALTDSGFRAGVNVINGHITNAAVAEASELPFTDLDENPAILRAARVTPNRLVTFGCDGVLAVAPRLVPVWQLPVARSRRTCGSAPEGPA